MHIGNKLIFAVRLPLWAVAPSFSVIKIMYYIGREIRNENIQTHDL